MRIGTISYAEFKVGDDPLDPSNDPTDNRRLAETSCPLERRAKLTSLVASSGAKQSTSHRTRDHAEVPADKSQHFYFAPGVDPLALTWVVENPDKVTGAALTVYSKAGNGTAIWSGVLDGTTIAAGTAPWAGPTLTAEHSPYAIQLTLTDGTIVDGYAAAWTYVDVVLSEVIALEWGDPGEIPNTRAEGYLKDLAWTLREEAATLARLRSPDGLNVAALTADHTVLLESNLFRDCNGVPAPAGNAHTGVGEYRRHWGDGPRIPIVAKVQVLGADDAPVWAPDAVGDVELLWDWEDPRAAVVDPWKAWIDLAETSALNQRVLELEVTRSNLTTEPKSFNCQTAFGGKVGAPEPVFPPVNPGARFKGRVAALGGAGRDWAAVTRVGVDATKPGLATVLFQPSRMAGDQYKLSVYLRDGALDLAKTGPDLRLQAAGLTLPRAATGTFEVMRRTTVYSLHPNGVNTDWGAIRDDIYKPAGVALEVVDTPITDQEYEDALDHSLNALLTPHPNHLDTHMCLRFGLERGRADCVVPVVSYPTYVENVRRAYEQNFIVRVQVPSNTWFGGLARDADGAKFQIVHGEQVSSKHYVWLLALNNDSLHKGDALTGLNNPALTTTLRDEPEAASLVERRRLFQRAMSGGGYVDGVSTAAAFAGRWGQLAWVKELSGTLMVRLVAQKCPNATTGAFIFQFPRTTLGDASGGSCIWKLSRAYTSYAWAATPALDNALPLLKTGTVVVAHEFGHALFLHHAKNTLREGTDAQPAPIEDEQHVPYASCLMNYDHDSARLCGVCMLHLRGWDLHALHGDISQNAEFQVPGVLNLLQLDINTDPTNPWHKVRYYTALTAARKHETQRDTYKAGARVYINALSGGGQAGATRISVLRNILLHWIDWLDACSTLGPPNLHALFRELNTLTTKVDDIKGPMSVSLGRRGDAFCDHKVRPTLAVTAAPTALARGALTLRAVPVPPNPLPLNWAAEAFDGVAEFTVSRASVSVLDAAVGGAAVGIGSIAGASLDGAGLAVYAEDSAPDAVLYTTQHQLKISGGSQVITVPLDAATLNWPAVPATRKLKVTPAIEYVGDAVLVGADPNRTPRRPLRLKCDKTFDGAGLFECSHPGLEFWDALVGGAKVVFDGAGNLFPGATLFAGKQLYVSATSESQSADDVLLRLTLNPGKTPLDTKPATRKLTAVLCKLNVCSTPLGRGSLGARVADDLKRAPGRFVHKQDNGKHARVPVIIEKARPNDYKGKLCLQETSAVSRLGLYKSATPARREAALDYYTISNDDVPLTGYVLWVEGTTTSAALSDAVLDLGIKDGKGDSRDYFEGGDQVAFTVVELTSMTVNPPVTPPLHPGQYRHVVSGASRPVTNRAPARAVTARNASDTLDLAAGPGPVVLIEGSGAVAADQRAAALSAQCVLSVTVVPAAAQAHVKWQALRHDADKGAVKAMSGPPTITVPDAANHPEVAALNTNAVGGFHVVAYVDPDGPPLALERFAEKRHPPCFLANVVLVRAQVVTAPAAVCNAGAYAKLDGTASADADFGAHFVNLKPLNLSAQVDLIGGGADAKLGLDKVVCGWVQNTMVASYPATYHCNGSDVSVHLRFVENPTVAVNKFHGQDFIAYPGSHPFVELATPFLDTIKEARAARFDAPKPAMGSSAQADTVGAVDGQRRTLTMSDAPTRTVEGWHPNSRYKNRGAHLTGFQWDLQFRAHVTVATQDASDLYTTLGYIDWRAQLDWTTTVHAQHAQNTYVENTAVAVTAQPAVVHPAPIMGVDAGAEFCWPSMIYTQLWDATDDPLNLGEP